MLRKIIATILIIVSLLFFYYLQSIILSPTRGQAMSMPFLVTLYASIVLLISAIGFVIGDNLYRLKLWSIIAILSQVIIIIKTTYICMIYHDREHNWNKDKHEWLAGTYGPGSENFYVIIIFSIFIITYCTWSLSRKKIK